MAFKNVKLVKKLKYLDLLAVPFQDKEGKTVYKLYRMSTRLLQLDDPSVDSDRFVYDEIKECDCPVSRKTFEATSDFTVDSNGILILETTPDALKKYKMERGAMDRDTIGDFMYDTINESILSDNTSRRWGRVSHNGTTLNTYHSSKFLSTKGVDGEYIQNFYTLTPKSVLVPIFGKGFVASKKPVPLFIESEPIRNTETGEDIIRYVNPYNMKYYDGMYAMLTDKTRKTGKNSILRNPTILPEDVVNQKVADLSLKARISPNTTYATKSAIDRFAKAI